MAENYPLGSLEIEELRPWEGAPGLDGFHLFSLIVNKMIGTGIFTSPVTVFLLTGQKNAAMGLWVAGFVYSLLSMWMYLDYTAALPFTGGELVYISEMTAHSRKVVQGKELPRSPLSAWIEKHILPVRSGGNPRRHCVLKRLFADGILAYVVYSVLFVTLFNSATNSIRLGGLILLFSVEAKKLRTTKSFPAINKATARLVGVFAFTLICLLQYLFPRAGRRLNKAFAVTKILLLLGLVGVGARLADTRKKAGFIEPGGWSEWHRDRSAARFSKALLAVLFSFEGWENATFVVGEIGPINHRIMRKAFMYAVIVVGLLYLTIVGVFLEAINWDELVEWRDTFYPPLYTEGNGDALIAWGVLGAFSALGNLNAIIYTFTRVKQAVGQANILPWSRIWKQDSPWRSPQGGLFLHWISTVIVIGCIATADGYSDSASIPGSLQTYSHAVIQLALSLLFYRLPGREAALDLNQYIPDNLHNRLSKTLAPFQAAVILCLAGFSAFMIVATALEARVGLFDELETYPGRNYSIILCSILLAAVLYYLLVFGFATRNYVRPRMEHMAPDEVAEPSQLASERGPLDLGCLNKLDVVRRLFHVKSVFYIDEWYPTGSVARYRELNSVPVERAVRFGRRWRVFYVLRVTDRPRDNPLDQSRNHLNFSYWLFGGQKYLPERPMREHFWQRLNFRQGSQSGAQYGGPTRTVAGLNVGEPPIPQEERDQIPRNQDDDDDRPPIAPPRRPADE